MGLDQWIYEVRYPEKFKEYLTRGFKTNDAIYRKALMGVVDDEIDTLSRCINLDEEVCYWRKCYPVQAYLESRFNEMEDCQYYVLGYETLSELYRKSKGCIDILSKYVVNDNIRSSKVSDDDKYDLKFIFDQVDDEDLDYLYYQLKSNMEGLKKCMCLTDKFKSMFVYFSWW